MTAAPGILLAHGFSGAPADLAPLAQELSRRWGPEAVACPALPGPAPP